MPTFPLAAPRRALAVLVLLLLAFLLPSTQAWALDRQPADGDDPGQRYFGTLLDWDKDSATDYAQRLG